MKQITREWLNAANDDILVIEKIEKEESLSNMVAFHAQQAIEKVSKQCLKNTVKMCPKRMI